MTDEAGKQAQKAQALEMLAQGESLRNTARGVGVSKSTVQRWAQEIAEAAPETQDEAQDEAAPLPDGERVRRAEEIRAPLGKTVITRRAAPKASRAYRSMWNNRF